MRSIDPVKDKLLNDKLTKRLRTIYNVQAYEDAYSIGMYVTWHNKKCLICNRRVNGQLLISPMGNGDAPAKYYTVKEWDVVPLNESVKTITDIVHK